MTTDGHLFLFILNPIVFHLHLFQFALQAGRMLVICWRGRIGAAPIRPQSHLLLAATGQGFLFLFLDLVVIHNYLIKFPLENTGMLESPVARRTTALLQ